LKIAGADANDVSATSDASPLLTRSGSEPLRANDGVVRRTGTVSAGTIGLVVVQWYISGKDRGYPMRMFPVVAMVAVLAGPAIAQDAPHVNLAPQDVSKSPEEKAIDDEREKAYKESLRKIPDAKTASDPWGGVRSADAPKSAAKVAKPKTKTGSSAN
jgi:hypothetical protein